MLNRFPTRESWEPLVATTGIERHPAHRGFEADDAAKCRGNPNRSPPSLPSAIGAMPAATAAADPALEPPEVRSSAQGLRVVGNTGLWPTAP